jgi:H+-transporting ATPase
MATNVGDVKAAVEKAVSEFAGRGFRSLGVARADQENKWQFVGVLPMFDPPRPEAKATIANAVQMGVKVKMVTGDQLAIAQETARQLGMGTNILDATVLHNSKDQQSQQTVESIEKADGFAQVFPEDKYNIVAALQKHGHIVGMTGDGVNDAPALKKADCGIAVSGATDAARAAASIVLLAPGLSVIIDAIKESRRIFQRMNSYSMYRIAETLRVLFFMTLAILVFNFYPVTAVMIVMIAVLNDGAILSIAYDNVHYSDKPEAWNMRLVLGISTVLGVIGVAAAFGLFYLGERVFHFDHAHVQTLMYLKLSVAGHLTIFLTRTRGPFWSIRPARILWVAVLGTQAVATLIAVYGLFMTPLGWRWAGFVWAYAIVCALLTDRVKLLAYKILDPVKADSKPEARSTTKAETKAEPKVESKPEAKTDQKSEAKPASKPEVKADLKPAANAESKPEAKPDAKPEKAPPDLTPQIAKRAYELYEERTRKGGRADQDWEKAEREIQKDAGQTESKSEPNPEGNSEPKAEASAETAPARNADSKPEAKHTTNPKAEPEPKLEPEASPQPEAIAEPKPKAGPAGELNLHIVKRVHELYETLGREDVREVEEWDKAQRENAAPKTPETETHK